jgi:hypothetical protein
MIIFDSMNKFQKICERIGLGSLFKKKKPVGGDNSKRLRRHLALRRLQMNKHIQEKLKDAHGKG